MLTLTLTLSFAGSLSYQTEFEILIKEQKLIIPPIYVQDRRFLSIISEFIE